MYIYEINKRGYNDYILATNINDAISFASFKRLIEPNRDRNTVVKRSKVKFDDIQIVLLNDNRNIDFIIAEGKEGNVELYFTQEFEEYYINKINKKD